MLVISGTNDPTAAIGDCAFFLQMTWKIVFPRSQSGRFLSSLSSAWPWSIKWVLAIKHNAKAAFTPLHCAIVRPNLEVSMGANFPNLLADNSYLRGVNALQHVYWEASTTCIWEEDSPTLPLLTWTQASLNWPQNFERWTHLISSFTQKRSIVLVVHMVIAGLRGQSYD